MGSKKPKVLGKSENGTDAELVAIALLCVMVMTFRSYPSVLPWSDAILWWIPVAMILLTSLYYNKREGFIGKILASKPLQWLGNISFEIFMLQGLAALAYNYWLAPVLAHIGVQDGYNMVANDLLGASAPGLIVWFILPIDILMAWAVNRLFTRPVSRLLRRGQ
jgi:peptidoglycan/LPS O-acetylase OafA/YrhL